MRRHITQGEILKINKLLRSGVTDRAEIQAHVRVHSDCIDASIANFEKANKVKKPAAKKKAVPKKKAEEVDPLS